MTSYIGNLTLEIEEDGNRHTFNIRTYMTPYGYIEGKGNTLGEAVKEFDRKYKERKDDE